MRRSFIIELRQSDKTTLCRKLQFSRKTSLERVISLEMYPRGFHESIIFQAGQ